jgi:hypothetical protein
MTFMVMHKVDEAMEAGTPPNQEIIRNMGALIGESAKSGVFLDGAGLHRSAVRARLHCAGGTCTVEKGPFQGANELVGGFAMIRAASLDEAIEHARRFAAASGDGEIEIGLVVEPWDIGLMPKPADTPTSRFLLLRKSDRPSESDAPADVQRQRALAALTDELKRAGVLLKSATLAPSATGKRLASGSGKRTWTDGPFAESKELVAGFSLLALPGMDDAVAWANRYAAVLGRNEVDIRVVRLADD